jgi:hypothetical protein
LETFREGAKAAKGAPESPPEIVRDEGDVAILTAAVRYAGAESNRRAIDRSKRTTFEARKAEREAAVEAKPESVQERLRIWAAKLTPGQIERFPFSDRYAKLNDRARALVDAALAEVTPEPEPPTAEEQARWEAGVEEPDEEDEFAYEGYYDDEDA